MKDFDRQVCQQIDLASIKKYLFQWKNRIYFHPKPCPQRFLKVHLHVQRKQTNVARKSIFKVYILVGNLPKYDNAEQILQNNLLKIQNSLLFNLHQA